jgi:hypothetical protein
MISKRVIGSIFSSLAKQLPFGDKKQFHYFYIFHTQMKALD